VPAWSISLHFRIRKGLTIPLSGAPDQKVCERKDVSSVALLGPDTKDLKPRMLVAAGDTVKLGQPLFEDKQNPGVQFTSPGSGTVTAINRGERRVLQSVVVALQGNDEEIFASYENGEWPQISRADAQRNLQASGLWSSFRTRPFSKIPRIDDVPDAIFVTATDTNPLAASPDAIIGAASEDFVRGLQIAAKLTDGDIYICSHRKTHTPCPDYGRFKPAEFSGPHPAGLAGTHIHMLHPVSESRTVWHIGYQDVIAVGHLFATGRLTTERVISLAGPGVNKPRLIRTRVGASIDELVAGETRGGNIRVISGSVLQGHRAAGWASWLGRYDLQATVIPESSPREFLSWMRPGFGKFSSARAYVGNLFSGKPYALSSSQNGSPRAMVSIGSFEQVMPLDILPTPLLKALLVRDTDTARDLGCLELDEEDLALCSFVCNGKYEYGPHLRKTLREIEVNG